MGKINATLPAFARKISEEFPELGGRVLPVSDSLVTQENVPTLPLCMLALLKGTAGKDSTDKRPQITEDFVVEFWYKSERYKTRDQSESPFWAYYDYDTLQERMLTITSKWLSPRNSRLKFISFDVEATQLAVVITFRFEHTFFHCDYEPPADDCKTDFDPFADGREFMISVNMREPPGVCCDDCGEDEVDCRKCEFDQNEKEDLRNAND